MISHHDDMTLALAGASAGPRRRRNALLEALTQVQRRAAHLSLTDLMALLYVAENPGISVAELAYICGSTTISASRAARRLSGQYEQSRSDQDFLPLLEIRPNPHDGRGLQLFLSVEGEVFRGQLNGIISDAVAIAPGEYLSNESDIN